MKNLLIATLLGLSFVTPAFAQLQTNGQVNNSNEWSMRSNAHFYKRTVFSMGAGQLNSSSGSLGSPQQMTAIGKIYSPAAPVSSITTGATTIGATLPAYTFAPMSSTAAFPSRIMHCRVYGRCAANANTKVVQFKFGSQTVTLLNAASNAKDFYAEISIYSTGFKTQQINVAGYANGSILDNLSTSATQDNTTQLSVVLNVPTSTGAADVVINGFEIYGES
jgi:hypothetical protein